MTGVTHITRWDMVATLTAGDRAIMTIKTGADDFRMIHRRGSNRRPTRREFLMTGITHITARDMTGIFTARRRPIVTGNTITDKRGVINGEGWYPGIGAMTIVTFQRGLNMIRRLTGC